MFGIFSRFFDTIRFYSTSYVIVITPEPGRKQTKLSQLYFSRISLAVPAKINFFKTPASVWLGQFQVGPCPLPLEYQTASSQARLKSCWALPPWSGMPTYVHPENISVIYKYVLNTCAGILEQSMEASNRVGIGLSCRPARARICKCLWSPGIDSASSCSLAGWFDSPICPTGQPGYIGCRNPVSVT